MTRSQTSLGFVMASFLAAALLAGSPLSAFASEDDASPKISSFASAADLSAELKVVVIDLEKAVASKDEYDSQVEGRFTRDGNLVTLIAIALGLNDEESSAKPHAKAIAAAGRNLAQAKGYEATKKAIDHLKAAVKGKGSGEGELKWGKVATLKSLMTEEVPSVNTRLKNAMRHFKSRTASVAANAATMALLAANADLYVTDTKKPDEGKKWTELAGQMRAAAVDVATKAHTGDLAGVKAAMDKLNESCHDCHAVFNPEKKD